MKSNCYYFYTRQPFLKIIIFLTSLIISSCTWNASIKNLDDKNTNETTTSADIALSECPENILLTQPCKISLTNRLVASYIGTNISAWTNPTQTTIVSAIIPDGYYSGQMCYLQDTNLIPSNIKSGTNIFGVTGNYSGSYQLNMASSANRDPGIQVIDNLEGQTTSNQINLDIEVNTYTGADLPTTAGYNYRDIPDVNKDNDSYDGTTCKYAQRPASNCGTTQNTIAARIADCATQNPIASTWNGATQCNRGQGAWKLVTRKGANKEVWQDQRTGQLWSSKVSSTVNWCQASGNTQMAPVVYSQSYNTAVGTPIIGNGKIGLINGGSTSSSEIITITFSSATVFTVSGLCGNGSITSGGLTTTPGSTVTWSRTNYCSFAINQGSTNFVSGDTFVLNSNGAVMTSCVPNAGSGLQPASAVSYCAEATGVNAPGGEDWGTGVYLAAKGGMGKTSTAQSPSVRWRLPSIEDYNIANVNGIRFVMPDMGIAGTNRPIPDGSAGGASDIEWTTVLLVTSLNYAWCFDSAIGIPSNSGLRSSSRAVRCVGR